jgi:hypothetical protein
MIMKRASPLHNFGFRIFSAGCLLDGPAILVSSDGRYRLWERSSAELNRS